MKLEKVFKWQRYISRGQPMWFVQSAYIFSVMVLYMMRNGHLISEIMTVDVNIWQYFCEQFLSLKKITSGIKKHLTHKLSEVCKRIAATEIETDSERMQQQKLSLIEKDCQILSCANYSTNK
jgi:hypothetical protein